MKSTLKMTKGYNGGEMQVILRIPYLKFRVSVSHLSVAAF